MNYFEAFTMYAETELAYTQSTHPDAPKTGLGWLAAWQYKNGTFPPEMHDVCSVTDDGIMDSAGLLVYCKQTRAEYRRDAEEHDRKMDEEFNRNLDAKYNPET